MKDLIERQAAIDVILADKIDNKSLKVMDALGSGNEAKTLNMTCDRHAELLKSLPSAQPEITPDGTLTVSVDADVASVGRILLSQTRTQRGGLYYKDEQPEIIRCRDCKHSEVADAEDTQDGYTCQFHRGSIWFSGSYCSWAERRTDE